MKKKQLILITGGSSGIGKNLAAKYLDLGEKVIIVADQAEKLQAAYDELKNTSSSIWSYVCDVGELSEVEKMTDRVFAEHGCPDILVNNAGFATYRTFDMTSQDELERLINVNLLGVLRTTRCFLPEMIKRRSGHIVNIASVSGLIPITPSAIYGAAKYGMVGISNTLRYELADYNIHVHLICPGKVDTPFFDHETFRTRTIRKEMEQYVPIETVIKKIINAVRKNRFLTIIPASLGIKIWLRNTFSALIEPYYKRIMLDRIRLVRKDAGKSKNIEE